MSDVSADDETWKTADGKFIAVRDMTDSHLLNARAWVERQYDRIRFCGYCDGCGRDAIFDDLCTRCQGEFAKKRLAWGRTWMTLFDIEIRRRRLQPRQPPMR